MTSKHRAPQPPNPGEYFATPDWCVRAILPHLPIGGSVLEPCAGEGAIVRALLASGVSPECIDDNSCVVRFHGGGVGTNGGCRCEGFVLRAGAMELRRYALSLEARLVGEP